MNITMERVGDGVLVTADADTDGEKAARMSMHFESCADAVAFGTDLIAIAQGPDVLDALDQP